MQIFNDDRHTNHANEHIHTENKAMEGMTLSNTMACPCCHSMMKMGEMKMEYKKCPKCNNSCMIPLIHMINLPMCNMAMNMLNNQVIWPAFPNSNAQQITTLNNMPNINQMLDANNNNLYPNNNIMPISNQLNSLPNGMSNNNSLVKTPITAKKATDLFD